MDSDTVQVLHELNPWWKRPGVVLPTPPPYRRPLVREISSRLSSGGGLIEIIRGPRQVGKTTAIHQVIEDLTTGGTSSRDILFVRFDDPQLRDIKGGLAALVRWHADSIRTPGGAGPAYLFLDEIHKVRRWDEQVKHVFDTYQARMVITGSSSVLVTKGGRESLAGRTLTSDLPTFQFREVLEAWDAKKTESLPARMRLRSLFDPAVAESFSHGLGLAPQQRYSLNRSLERYYNRGGYPRLHSKEVPDDRWADYIIEAVFDRVLGVDIPDLFPVQQPALMRHIYLTVAKQTGQEIAQVSLAESANAAGYRTNQPTVGRYLHYLADALLIREYRRYPLVRRVSARVPAKVCLSDLGVRNAILRGAPSLWESSPDVVGPLVETLAQAVIRDSNMQVHYYRENENPANRRSPQIEVDFVAEDTDGRVLPVEIKFRRTVDLSDTKSLRHFIVKHRSPCGILVTRDTLGWDPSGPILSIPLLDFLLRLG